MKRLERAALLSGVLLIACGSDDNSGTSTKTNTTMGTGGSGGQGASNASCTGMTLPPVELDGGDLATAYGAMGPFATVTEMNTGPDGNYTLVRPDPLGQDGFLHPPTTWGNGITTTPANYQVLLNTIASNGFVVIASNNTNVTAQLMQAGLDWLIAQNDVAGEFQGKLATSCGVSIGYSLGGGAAVGAGADPAVVTTVSFHGLTGASQNLHGPLFLLTSTNDGFVTKAQFVQPTYDQSTVVPTLMATLNVPGATPDITGHLIPLNDAGQERAPAVAWLRYWVLGDEGARNWFFGPSCILCMDPWTVIQRKNGDCSSPTSRSCWETP
jgi:hypothetical protein